MIVLALLLQAATVPGEPAPAATAAPARAGGGMRPEVEAAFARARLAWLYCLRRQADVALRTGRRTNREAALDAAFLACQGDENAMGAALRRQYDQRAADSLMASLRAAIRDSLRTYLRR
jgi:hypothetical protein